MYKRGKPLYQLLTEESDATYRAVGGSYGNPLKAIIGALDLQFEILDHTAWSYGQSHFSGRDVTEPTLISALHKNTFLFFSAIELARRGLFGPANTVLRPIFEALIIAKYCQVSTDTAVFENWFAGKHVHLTNEVLNRIRRPAVDELRIFWKSLNQLSHATVYAQQISPTYKDIKNDIGVTLSLVQLLLCLNLHLLSRHFLTPATLRYTRLHGNAGALASARERARGLAETARKSFTRPGKQVVREYCATWEVRL